jgi:hypothetical protein
LALTTIDLALLSLPKFTSLKTTEAKQHHHQTNIMKHYLLVTVILANVTLHSSAQMSKVKWTQTLMPADLFGTNVDKTRIKTNGPAVHIYTKVGNLKLQSILSEDDNHPYIIADEKPIGLTDLWQFIGYDKKDLGDDYSFIVSAFSGLNIQAMGHTDGYPMVLDKHQSKSYRNELFALQPVPDEDGWYYIRNRNTDMYISLWSQPATMNYGKITDQLIKLSPKHNPMVVRIQDGTCEMVYDYLSQFDDNGDDRCLRVVSVPGMNGLSITTKRADVTLTTDNGTLVAGTKLVGTKKTDVNTPTFNLEKISDNLYKITLVKDPSLCLEVKNSSKDNKTPLVLGKYTGAANQQFYVRIAVPTYFIQTKEPSDLSKFRFENAGPVDWKGR